MLSLYWSRYSFILMQWFSLPTALFLALVVAGKGDSSLRLAMDVFFIHHVIAGKGDSSLRLLMDVFLTYYLYWRLFQFHHALFILESFQFFMHYLYWSRSSSSFILLFILEFIPVSCLAGTAPSMADAWTITSASAFH